jgi:hypothetical protein
MGRQEVHHPILNASISRLDLMIALDRARRPGNIRPVDADRKLVEPIPPAFRRSRDARAVLRMMMAQDSSPTPPSGLAEETTNAVRAALLQYLRAPASPSELRDALNRMADEARTKAILPEHLLITLKQIWSSLPEVRSVGDVEDQTRMLQRVVTMCIREYYE